MSRIPNIRTDKNYNEKYLDQAGKDFLAGFDAAVAEILHLQGNLDVYAADNLTCHLLLENEKMSKELFEAIKDWLEMSRNEIGTSLIDALDDQVYQDNKKKIDNKEDSNA